MPRHEQARFEYNPYIDSDGKFRSAVERMAALGTEKKGIRQAQIFLPDGSIAVATHIPSSRYYEAVCTLFEPQPHSLTRYQFLSNEEGKLILSHSFQPNNRFRVGIYQNIHQIELNGNVEYPPTNYWGVDDKKISEYEKKYKRWRIKAVKIRNASGIDFINGEVQQEGIEDFMDFVEYIEENQKTSEKNREHPQALELLNFFSKKKPRSAEIGG